MPIGIKNTVAFFVCMMLALKQDWAAEFLDKALALHLIDRTIKVHYTISAREFDRTLPGKFATAFYEQDELSLAVIIDNLMVCARAIVVILAYFQGILMTLEHDRVSSRLRKTRFLPAYAELVGINTASKGNSPARSKYECTQKR
jgi:hypothetical protein